MKRKKIDKKRKQLMTRQKKLAKKKKTKKVDLDKIIKEFDQIKKERHELPTLLKNNIKKNSEKISGKKCTHKRDTRECICCNNNSMCNDCNICHKCKKNLSYYVGIEDDKVKKYNKVRIRVEYFNSHFKQGKMRHVTYKKRSTLTDSVYCRLVNFVIWDKLKSPDNRVAL